jgi:hypothetical protein
MSQQLALAAMSASLVLLREQIKNKKPKRWRMRQLFEEGHRNWLDLLDTLKLEDGSGFRNFIRMTPTDFDCLLKMIGGKISKQNTRFSIVHTVKSRSVLTHWLLTMPPEHVHIWNVAQHCVSDSPLRMGRKEHLSELSLSSSDSLVQCCGAVRTQPRFSPDSAPQHRVAVCTRHYTHETWRFILCSPQPTNGPHSGPQQSSPHPSCLLTISFDYHPTTYT